MNNINGSDNIIINGNDNTVSIIREVIKMQNKISDANKISSIILNQIQTNHELLRGKNPNSIYLAGLTKDHIDLLVNDAINGLLCANSGHTLIDASGLTLTALYNQIAGTIGMSSHNAFLKLTDDFYHTSQVVVIKSISKLKYSDCAGVCRDLIKILDDAHYKDIHPKTDLIFIDSALFLEKHYSVIGNYLTTNIVG